MTAASLDLDCGVNSANMESFDKVVDNNERTEAHGIGIGVASLFVMGAIAGAGIMAMPNAFLKAGWWAVPLVTVMSVIGCLTGLQLSWCWSMLQENWPKYSQQTRNPYSAIAYRAGGRPFKYCAQTCVHLSLFGAAVAFLILSAKNISHLMNDWFGVTINFCYVVLIIGICILPALFLGTPKDFWLIAVGAIAATTLAIIFVIAGTVTDMAACQNKVTYPEITLAGFISSYCTICFAYGGHGAFPTIQHDMKRPEKFSISVVVSFLVLFLLYLPMPVLSYFVYGHTVHGTIDTNLSTKWVRDIIMVLITGHVLFAFFIVISPVVQDFERIVGIPLHFSWKRACTRTLMMATVIFVALSLPDFNVVLELVGGTSTAFTVYILPGPFYVMLKRKVQKLAEDGKGNVTPCSRTTDFLSHRSSRGIQCWEYAINFVVVFCGLLGAVATIYGVIISESGISKPCYLNSMNLEYLKTNENMTQCWADDIYTASNSSSFMF